MQVNQIKSLQKIKPNLEKKVLEIKNGQIKITKELQTSLAALAAINLSFINLSTPSAKNSDPDELANIALTQNPAYNTNKKITEMWANYIQYLPNQQTTKTLPPQNQKIYGEVPKLILEGKLKEKLEDYYNDMTEYFQEIGEERSKEIVELTKLYRNNKLQYGKELIKILAEDFAMKGFEPELKISAPVNDEAGRTNWYKGIIYISDNVTSIRDFTAFICHEFIHFIQYKDILTQFGEGGVRYMINNDAQIPANEKEVAINFVLNNHFTKNILENYGVKPSPKGSINEYKRSLYANEFTDLDCSDEEYFSKIIESEAYYQGCNKLINSFKINPKLAFNQPITPLKKYQKENFYKLQNVSVKNNTKPSTENQQTQNKKNKEV